MTNFAFFKTKKKHPKRILQKKTDLLAREFLVFRQKRVVIVRNGFGPNLTQKLAQELRFPFVLINDPSP
jgi:hypothetical protein